MQATWAIAVSIFILSNMVAGEAVLSQEMLEANEVLRQAIRDRFNNWGNQGNILRGVTYDNGLSGQLTPETLAKLIITYGVNPPEERVIWACNRLAAAHFAISGLDQINRDLMKNCYAWQQEGIEKEDIGRVLRAYPRILSWTDNMRILDGWNVSTPFGHDRHPPSDVLDLCLNLVAAKQLRERNEGSYNAEFTRQSEDSRDSGNQRKSPLEVFHNQAQNLIIYKIERIIKLDRMLANALFEEKRPASLILELITNPGLEEVIDICARYTVCVAYGYEDLGTEFWQIPRDHAYFSSRSNLTPIKSSSFRGQVVFKVEN